ncbi:MAG TPA: glycosyl hydrolase family 28-related protein, partial [Chthoniobacteraceae bacterium]|nr:glycosyl hydrolase family 28-related protein [Chthoniobacteraceae bacterium]
MKFVTKPFRSSLAGHTLAPSDVRSFAAALGIFLLSAMGYAQEPWRSELYPEDWAPPVSQKFETDKFLQDFSYAGYHRGDKEVPRITSPVFDVTSYGADATGVNDSTAAIQRAIDEAGAQGGGVVFLPSGTFRVSPQGTDNWALRIRQGNTVLRGAGRDKTFLFNASYMMRLKSIILAQGAEERWKQEPANGPVAPITSDLLSPTKEIPVESVEGFKPGDWIILRTDATDDFIAEHNMSDKWGGKGDRLGG